MTLPLVLLACGSAGCHEPPVAPERSAPETSTEEPAEEPVAEAPDGDAARARLLFARHCAPCHGATGAGDGPCADLLHPPARDFSHGFFRLTSTTNGVPTEDDLVATLRRGMPGSAMPPFAWMAERDLGALARHVRSLAREGMLAGMTSQALAAGQPLDLALARELVDGWLAPGEVIEPLPALDPTPEVLERGRELYQARCAQCHGLDGRGRGGAPQRHEDGSLTWARDFTAGILKGGASRLDLTRRIRAGLPGSAMPPTQLADRDLASLVAYLQRLIPAGAPERHVQVRTRLVAPRRDGPPDEGAWAALGSERLHLAPLSWSAQSVLDVDVAAVHDGERLFVRLTWEDASPEDRALGGSAWFDGAALQLSREPEPPLFGMGAEGHPVNLWHWSAARWSDVAGVLDALEGPPHGEPAVARSDVPLYVPAPERSAAEELAAQGAGRVAADGHGLTAEGRWADGRWSVVLARPLAVEGTREVSLAPGETLQVGFAVWNGAAGDDAGRKSVTIWHELSLER